MLYTFNDTNFKKHVHANLKRRIRIFMILSAVMLIVVVADVVMGILAPKWGVLSLVIGSLVGFISSRIFHLSWSNDGEQVVGRIDTIGWFVLAAYILFEIGRSYLFQMWLPASATAITFAFVASALITRVLGLRGRIITILKEEKVFG